MTDLRFCAGCQGMDDLVGRNWSCRWGSFLVLETPARWSGHYCSGRGGVQPLTVGVLVQSCVPRLGLILPHHEPWQRQVFDWWDRNPVVGLEERVDSDWLQVLYALNRTTDSLCTGRSLSDVISPLWLVVYQLLLTDEFTFVVILSNAFLLQFLIPEISQNALRTSINVSQSVVYVLLKGTKVKMRTTVWKQKETGPTASSKWNMDSYWCYRCCTKRCVCLRFSGFAC